MTLKMPSPYKDPLSGIFYLNVRVPTDLVGKIGRRKILKSLRTRDPSEAKQRFSKEYATLQKQWTALRAGPKPLPHKQLVALSGRIYSNLMDILEDEPGEAEIWHQVLRLSQQAEAAVNGFEQWYGDAADQLLAEEGIVPDRRSRERLLREVHNAWTQAAEQQLKRAGGDYSEDPAATRFPKWKSEEQARNTNERPTLTALFERWRNDHLSEGKSAKTITDFSQKLQSLKTYLGHEDVARMTNKEISEWCQYLRDEKGLASKTVSRKYLAAVRAILRHGQANFLITTNPTEGVVVKVAKRIITRPKGFTDEETKKILLASLAALEQNSKVSKYNRLARRWLPWICAYTGARGGEIAQLRKQDLSWEDEIPWLTITPEAGTVKSRQFRTVPVHPHLQELGLTKFISDAPMGYLFHSGAQNLEQAIAFSSNVRDKIASWVRHEVGVTDNRIQPNHAWRHRFKTLGRNHAIGLEYLDALQGHTGKGASEDYGEYSIRALYREICKLPRVELYD
ncbi:DUF6538 domain-containing protein [Poseidonocella pacifica]|uniref:DUF6538 domain-containing protein n=1 Tax=Poseidonocella pacifica TaxID=871651 RepID=UPI0011140B1A|nr:DUF6538 domain-containing protein [Poseidonocella pacifica]